ncbi:MAG TPA: twin-arginine translocase TatA/TatE family subunit [Ktedonobacteraceae bacterium]
MPFGFHGPDLIIILAIALLIFGPKKLPEMGASVGKSIKEFKKGMAELTEPKAEKPAAYETVAAEAPIANYTASEPVVADYTAAEPVSEIYEKPASFESEVKETEVNAQ